MFKFLSGYRTYLVSAAMIVAAGLHAQGYINDATYATLQSVLLGGGLMALRAGISKAGNGK